MQRFLVAMLIGSATSASPPTARAQNVAMADAIADAAATVLDRPARLHVQDIALSEALTELSASSGVQIAFSPSRVEAEAAVSCACMEASVGEALDLLLALTDFRYVEVDEHVVVLRDEKRGPRPGVAKPRYARPVYVSVTSIATRHSALLGRAGAATTGTSPQEREGTIAGRVLDGSTNRPLAGVQVSIAALEQGALTQQDGRFVIANVPAGTHSVEARSIGYGVGEEEVVVVSGETVEITFNLETRAIALDQVIVSASPAGEARRRALGTSVTAVDVETRLRDAPVMSLNDVLQGREPGVINMASSGTTGAAGLNILRGITSLTQDNQPLIYIDGVRLLRDNRTEVSTGGQTLSRLNDINPQDIARIEIIKGSAAAAMYGSEASSGVIQIFTKRGRPGETSYDVDVRLGANYIPKNLPLQHPDPSYPSANDFLSTGLYQEYGASVRGATEQLSYFLSGSHLDSEGSFVNNFQRRTAGRGNMTFQPSESFRGTLSSAFSTQETRLTTNDNVITGVLTNVYLGNPVERGTEFDPYGSAFEPVWQELNRSRIDSNHRYMVGLSLDHRLTSGFSHRVTVGLDYLESEGNTLDPWFEQPGREPQRGSKSVVRRRSVNTNIDYGANFTFNLSDNLQSVTNFGTQFYTRDDHRTTAQGEDFIAPPLEHVDGTESQEASEGVLKYTTGGLMVEQQFGYRDRLFLSVGVRMDGSSAFGEDFGFSTFPKANVSYIISDEDWFNVGGLSMLRLRAAWGTAGTQPGAFAKLRLWDTTQGLDNQRGFRPGNRGNSDLGPEVSREFEAGFDAGFFDNRMSIEATAYHQRTDDILIEFDYPISTGILSSQLRNAGGLRNRGLELSSTVILIDRERLRWGLDLGYAYNDNKILDLAGSPRQTLDRFGTQIVEGYPISGKWERVIVGYDEDGFPIASDTAHYIGPSIPPHTGNVGTDLTFGPVTVRATSQFALGHVVNYHLRPYMALGLVGEDYYNVLIANGNEPDHPNVERFLAEMAIYGENIVAADWFKVRELSASFTVPAALAGRLGVREMRLMFAGRNLLTFTRYPGVDPEVSSTFSSNNNLSIGADYFTVPPQRHVLFGVHATF